MEDQEQNSLILGTFKGSLTALQASPVGAGAALVSIDSFTVLQHEVAGGFDILRRDTRPGLD